MRSGVPFCSQIRQDIACTLVEPRRQKPNRRRAAALKSKGLESVPQVQYIFSKDFWEGPECPAAIKNSSVVVGLHPDQATEPIVDFALQHAKPFAVVPCCVFPHLSPNRLLNGRQVVTYAEFIAYLQQKDSRIQVDFLNIDGRNRVLWFDPQSVAPAHPDSRQNALVVDDVGAGTTNDSTRFAVV